MAAVDAFEPESSAQSAAQDKNYLFDAVIARIVQAPVKWRLVVTIGEPADPTDDATTPWPSNREHVDVGTLLAPVPAHTDVHRLSPLTMRRS